MFDSHSKQILSHVCKRTCMFCQRHLLYVEESNICVARVVLIALLAIAMGHTVLLEQPASSCLLQHPMFRLWEEVSNLGYCLFERVHLWMGLYGNPAPKPTQLLISHQWAQVTCCAILHIEIVWAAAV